jgi:hypothetical protein
VNLQLRILLEFKRLSYNVPHREAGCVAAVARRCNFRDLNGKNLFALQNVRCALRSSVVLKDVRLFTIVPIMKKIRGYYCLHIYSHIFSPFITKLTHSTCN